MSDTFPPLDDYVDVHELYPLVQQTFSTKDSLIWFYRGHRAALVAIGAMIKPAGRNLFHPERFKQAVVQIGAQQASS